MKLEEGLNAVKVALVKEMRDKGDNPYPYRFEVNTDSAKIKKEADYFVSGSYTTKAKNPKNSIKNLMNKLN